MDNTLTTVKLTGNFLATARCLIFSDGGGISWNFNQNTNTLTASATSGGTFLSSVGLSDASTTPIYTVGNSPLTVNGALTITLNTQTKNLVFAGPGTGANAQPTFRALVAADLPAGTTPAGANPTASIGLTAVNGSAVTFMRSDGAPLLSQAISPTWNGTHTWLASSGSTVVSFQTPSTATYGIAQVTDQTGTRSLEMVFCGSTTAGAYGAAAGTAVINAQKGTLTLSVADAAAVVLTTTGTKVAGNFSCNGNALAAQSTGWGTPTGGTVVASFAAGATPSLLQMSEAVAQIITVLKQVGIFGA